MTAEILTIGDELLIGQVVNTNQAYIAEALNGVGIRVARMTTAGDDLADILQAFRRAWDEQDVVIVTGGLGPTHDDITKKAVCTFFDTDLVSNPEVRAHIVSLMQQRNMPWSPAAEEQTLVPRSAQLIPNPHGTASGLLFGDDARTLIVLPGVPYEMKAMMTQTVLPLLVRRAGRGAIRHRTLRTTGISESALTQKLGDIDALLQGARLAFLPSPTGVRLRITVHDNTPEQAERRSADVEERIRQKVGTYIYGTGTEELQEVVGTLLARRHLTIAVAESCTGGLIADRLTDVSGSSVYFERGLVTYSNRSKVELLGVPEELLVTHGAVSKEVALAMAEGVRSSAETDIGVSCTGIAGPTGGTEEKPVGLVWIGFADARGSLALRFNFGGPREVVKERAAHAALELVRRRVMELP
jgi:nicotinamide-nucleotide amidase